MAMERTATAVEGLARLFGVELPTAIDQAAKSAEGLADRINRTSRDVAGAAPLRNEGGLHEDWRRVLLSGDRS